MTLAFISATYSTTRRRQLQWREDESGLIWTPTANSTSRLSDTQGSTDECPAASACARRLSERGATEPEVVATIEAGERFPAKFGRTGFRRNLIFGGEWLGRKYSTKQVEAYAVPEEDGWLVITVLVKFF